MTTKKDLIQVFDANDFAPPGTSTRPWLYHSTLKYSEENNFPRQKVYTNAINYYDKPVYHGGSNPAFQNWEQTVNQINAIARNEQKKEIALLNIYYPEEYSFNKTINYPNDYPTMIDDLNVAIGSKDLYNFAKEIGVMIGRGKKGGKAYNPKSLVRAISEGIWKEVAPRILNLLTNSPYTQIIIDELTDPKLKKIEDKTETVLMTEIFKITEEGFRAALTKDENGRLVQIEEALIEGNADVKSLAGAIEFLRKFADGDEYIKKLAKTYVPDMGIKSFIKSLQAEAQNPNFKQNFTNITLKKLQEDKINSFEAKFLNNPSAISKMGEEIPERLAAIFKFTKDGTLYMDNEALTSHMSSTDNIGRVIYSLKGINEKDVEININEAYQEGAASDKNEFTNIAKEGFEKLEEQAKKAAGVEGKYSIINFNLKTGKQGEGQKSEFSAGKSRNLRSMVPEFTALGVSDSNPIANKLLQFSKGFIFEKESFSEDFELLISHLIVFINRVLFDDFADPFTINETGVHILLLNHINVPYSYLLFSLADSLSKIDKKVESGINITSSSGGKRQIRATDKNKTVRVMLSAEASISNGIKNALKKSTELNKSEMEALWTRQALEDADKARIKYDFLNTFENKIYDLFKDQKQFLHLL